MIDFTTSFPRSCRSNELSSEKSHWNFPQCLYRHSQIEKLFKLVFKRALIGGEGDMKGAREFFTIISHVSHQSCYFIQSNKTSHCLGKHHKFESPTWSWSWAWASWIEKNIYCMYNKRIAAENWGLFIDDFRVSSRDTQKKWEASCRLRYC